MAKERKTPYALKEETTGEIHYFDYPIDKAQALVQMTPEGKYRFVDISPNKVFNPRGEQVFPRRVMTTQGKPIEDPIIPKVVVDENNDVEDLKKLSEKKKGRSKKEEVEAVNENIPEKDHVIIEENDNAQ